MATSKIKSDGIDTVAASKLTGALPASMNEITKQGSDPTVSTNPAGGVGSMILNTSSGKLFVCTDATAGANVWKAGESGTVEPFTGMAATGGTVTTDGDYKVHSFTSSGTFQVTTVGTIGTVEYLVVAGGGGGGNDHTVAWGGGGGGAGGYLVNTAYSVSAQSYTVTVGAGGAMDANGSDSVFGSVTSDGGGRGGVANAHDGANGGSGGGGHGSSGPGGTATAGQGNNGGQGAVSPNQAGGGGGGAGAVGEGENNLHNLGGDGLQNDITGTNTYYAGGGGAGSSMGSGDPTNAGGQGGGGTGGSRSGSTAATAGGVNLGGGGGGGAYQTNTTSGSGGSGVVIIRYKFQ